MFQLKSKTGKLLRLVLSMLMIFGLLPCGILKPVAAWAAESQETVSYRYPVYNMAGNPASGIKKWETGTVTSYTEIKEWPITNHTWGKAGSETWYVVSGGTAGSPITSSGITVLGNVHVILKDGCNLSVSGGPGGAGICVTGGANSLSIYAQSTGTGRLEAKGGSNIFFGGAGIGGNGQQTGDSITINGGTIKATGGIGCAGIGGGDRRGCDKITINGGTVEASGYDGGAGIGAARGGRGTGAITINGGTVRASGALGGAGIGGGDGASGSNITITGGTVTAIGSNSFDGRGQSGAAGIGGGLYKEGSNIRITGGVVNAVGGINAWGIGSSGAGSPKSVNIKVSKSVPLMAGGAANPTDEVAHEDDTDLSGNAAFQKQYVQTANYLTFTAQEDNSSITFNYKDGSNVQYKKNSEAWKDCGTGTTVDLNTGNTVSFRGSNVKTNDTDHFSMTGKIAAGGDVTSLTNRYGGDTGLSSNCYENMFSGCASLTAVPELPAKTLAKGCYKAMFNGCVSLMIGDSGTKEWKIPNEASTAESWNESMFGNTFGSVSEPALNTTYYQQSTPWKQYWNSFGAGSDIVKFGKDEIDLNLAKAAANANLAAGKKETAWVVFADKTGGKYSTIYWDTSTNDWKEFEDGKTLSELRTYAGTDGSFVYVIGTVRTLEVITEVMLLSDKMIYTGEEVSVNIAAVKAGTKTLETEDYTVTGDKGTEIGSYTLKVAGNGQKYSTKEITKSWTIKNAGPVAPTGLEVTNPSSKGGSDGKISGVDSTMEYSADNKESWTKVSGTEITGLSEGVVYVRVAGTASAYEGDAALVIVGDIIVVDVEFDLDGKGKDTPETQHVASGSIATKPYPDPTYSGWSFKYWFKQGTTAAFDFATKIIENIKLIAFWEENPAPEEEYTISFDANGGSGEMDDQTTTSRKLTLPENEFTAPEGKEFDGWGVGSASAATKAAGTEVTFAANTTVYAKWKDESPVPVEEYTISFNANGGSGSMNDMETKDRKLTLPENAFTAPEGKEFDGWGVGSAAAATKAAGTEVTFTANTTVYAKWKDESPVPPTPTEDCIVRFDFDSDATKTRTVKKGTKIDLPQVSKAGYSFKGWAIQKEEGDFVPSIADSPYEITEDVLLHAMFAEVKKIDDKDVDVITLSNEVIDESGIHTEEKEAKAAKELAESKSVAVTADILGAVKSDALKEYLKLVADADTLTFGLKISLSGLSGFDTGSSNTISVSYQVKPWVSASNGFMTNYKYVENQELSGKRIAFRLAVPSEISEVYAKVEHYDETGNLVETLQLPIRTTVVDSKTEKYVEASASSFSTFKLSFYNATPDPTPSGDNGGSSSSAAKPVKTGTWGDPVTDGTWINGSDGKWMYRTNAYFKNTWGFIRNPYAKEGQEKDSWFWFDANGKMLTGWQFINNNWYYLNPVSDGTQGRCYLDTTTPDGYKVDKNGARIK